MGRYNVEKLDKKIMRQVIATETANVDLSSLVKERPEKKVELKSSNEHRLSGQKGLRIIGVVYNANGSIVGYVLYNDVKAKHLVYNVDQTKGIMEAYNLINAELQDGEIKITECALSALLQFNDNLTPLDTTIIYVLARETDIVQGSNKSQTVEKITFINCRLIVNTVPASEILIGCKTGKIKLANMKTVTINNNTVLEAKRLETIPTSQRTVTAEVTTVNFGAEQAAKKKAQLRNHGNFTKKLVNLILNDCHVLETAKTTNLGLTTYLRIFAPAEIIQTVRNTPVTKLKAIIEKQVIPVLMEANPKFNFSHALSIVPDVNKWINDFVKMSPIYFKTNESLDLFKSYLYAFCEIPMLYSAVSLYDLVELNNKSHIYSEAQPYLVMNTKNRTKILTDLYSKVETTSYRAVHKDRIVATLRSSKFVRIDESMNTDRVVRSIYANDESELTYLVGAGYTELKRISYNKYASSYNVGSDFGWVSGYYEQTSNVIWPVPNFDNVPHAFETLRSIPIEYRQYSAFLMHICSEAAILKPEYMMTYAEKYDTTMPEEDYRLSRLKCMLAAYLIVTRGKTAKIAYKLLKMCCTDKVFTELNKLNLDTIVDINNGMISTRLFAKSAGLMIPIYAHTDNNGLVQHWRFLFNYLRDYPVNTVRSRHYTKSAKAEQFKRLNSIQIEQPARAALSRKEDWEHTESAEILKVVSKEQLAYYYGISNSMCRGTDGYISKVDGELKFNDYKHVLSTVSWYLARPYYRRVQKQLRCVNCRLKLAMFTPSKSGESYSSYYKDFTGSDKVFFL